MIASIFSGIICMIGGILLLSIKEAGSQSLLGVIANGIGIYCIGKGLYVIFQAMELNELISTNTIKKFYRPSESRWVDVDHDPIRKADTEDPKEGNSPGTSKSKNLATFF